MRIAILTTITGLAILGTVAPIVYLVKGELWAATFICIGSWLALIVVQLMAAYQMQSKKSI